MRANNAVAAAQNAARSVERAETMNVDGGGTEFVKPPEAVPVELMTSCTWLARERRLPNARSTSTFRPGNAGQHAAMRAVAAQRAPTIVDAGDSAGTGTARPLQDAARSDGIAPPNPSPELLKGPSWLTDRTR